MKNYHKIIVIAFMALVHLTSSAQSNKKTENIALNEAKQAIAASNVVYFDAFVKNDSSIFIDRYAKDGCIMAPNGPAVCGPNAFAEFFRAGYQEYGLRNGKFITTAVYGDGKEFVTEEGLWQSIDSKGKVFDDGKFLVLWKKTPEGWKMFRDSFSCNHTPK